MATLIYLALILAVDAFSHSISISHGHGYNVSHPANLTANGTLLMAYHRSVAAGAAWVMPASPFDLGARAMTCECFDPDENCCMPSSSGVAPFCIPKDASCCADTVCIAGETCCGDYCCRSETTCSTDSNVPGCCPKGQNCNNKEATPVCVDHSSPNCTNTLFPPQQCCPPSVPFSRSFGSQGCGCFSNPTNSSIAPGSTSQPNTATATATATATYRGTTTLIETVSVKFVSSSALSLDFPETPTLASSLPGWSIATTYVFSFPSTIFDTTSSQATKKSSSSTTASSSSKSSSSTSPEKSSLCFDPNLQSPTPCTSPPIPGSASSSAGSSAALSYPAATTLHSSAQRNISALNVYYIFSSLALMYLFIHVDFTYKLYVILLWITNGALRVWMMYRPQGKEHKNERIDGCGGKYGMEGQGSGQGFWKQVGEVVAYTIVMPLTVGWETIRKIWADWIS